MQSHDIRRLRARLQITQKELAGTLGVSTHAVYKWESGRSAPSGTNLLAMYALLSEVPTSSKDLKTVAALSSTKGKLVAIHTLADDIEHLEDSMLTSLIRELVKDAKHIDGLVSSQLKALQNAS